MSECTKILSLFFVSTFCSTNAFYTTNEENIRQLSQYLDQMKKASSTGGCVCSGTSSYCICNLRDGTPYGSNVTTLTPVAAAAYEYMTLLRTENKDKPKPAEKGATPSEGNATPTEEVVPSPDGGTRRRRMRQTVEDPKVVSTLAPSAEEPPVLPPTTKAPEVVAPPTTPRPTMITTPRVPVVSSMADASDPESIHVKMGSIPANHPIMKHLGTGTMRPAPPSTLALKTILYAKVGDTPKEIQMSATSPGVNSLNEMDRFIVIIPGFAGRPMDDDYVQLRDKVIKYYANYNTGVLTVDHSNLVAQEKPSYVQAVLNTISVGRYLAIILERLIERNKISANEIHLIGFDIGSYIAAEAGKHYGRMTGLPTPYSRIGRITALDPQAFLIPKEYSFKESADFVDVIHTSATRKTLLPSTNPELSDFMDLLKGNVGRRDSIGNTDFRPNGGSRQPDCPDYGASLCHHAAALKYFIKSLDPKAQNGDFTSVPCIDYASTTECMKILEDERASASASIMGIKAADSCGTGRGNQYLRYPPPRKFQFSMPSDRKKRQAPSSGEAQFRPMPIDTPNESSIEHYDEGTEAAQNDPTYQGELDYSFDTHRELQPITGVDEIVSPYQWTRPFMIDPKQGGDTGDDEEGLSTKSGTGSQLPPLKSKKMNQRDCGKFIPDRKRKRRQVEVIEEEIFEDETPGGRILNFITGRQGDAAPPQDVAIEKGNYKSVVSIIEDSSRFVCSGAVIADGWVLTAASCFINRPDGWLYEVNFESNVWVGDNKSVTVRKTDGGRSGQILIHEEYKFCGHGNNIAVINTGDSVDGRKGLRGVSAVCVTGPPVTEATHAAYFEYDNPDERVTVLGYGSLGGGDMERNLRLYKEENMLGQGYQCGRQNGDPSGMFCSFIKDNHCSYDPGSPIVIQYRGISALIGIVSHLPIASPGCVKGAPVIYTRIDKMIPWIKEKIGEPDE